MSILFAYPTSQSHYHLPPRAHYVPARDYSSSCLDSTYGRGLSSKSCQLQSLSQENERLERRLAALERQERELAVQRRQQLEYEMVLANELRRRDAAIQRLAQYQARGPSLPSTRCHGGPSGNCAVRLFGENPEVLSSSSARPQVPLTRRPACRRSLPPSEDPTKPHNEAFSQMVDFITRLLSAAQDVPEGETRPEAQTQKVRFSEPQTKDDTNHLEELLRRREEFASLFGRNKPTDKVAEEKQPVASGSNVKLPEVTEKAAASEESDFDRIAAAATTIQNHWRTLHSRSLTSASLAAFSQQLDSTIASFHFPTSETYEFKAPSSDSQAPVLAFNATNTPILTYEHQLMDLLAKVDGVDSHGSEVVREGRKRLVKKIGEELEMLDQWKAEVWARQSSPVSRSGVLADEDLLYKSKGKERDIPVPIEDDLEYVGEKFPAPAPSSTELAPVFIGDAEIFLVDSAAELRSISPVAVAEPIVKLPTINVPILSPISFPANLPDLGDEKPISSPLDPEDTSLDQSITDSDATATQPLPETQSPFSATPSITGTNATTVRDSDIPAELGLKRFSSDDPAESDDDAPSEGFQTSSGSSQHEDEVLLTTAGDGSVLVTETTSNAGESFELI